LATSVSVTRTNNAEIDGLLGGTKWTGTVTYSFPDSPSDYAANYSTNKEPTTGFLQAPAAEQQAIDYAVGLILSYTNLSIQFAGTNGADIRVAQSSAANPTSYAYYPSNSVTGTGGDVWFGTAYNYSLAKLGNYYFTTAIHELGHAFGLKHSQELGGVANVAVPAAHDDSEFTVMSYRSYVGGPLTGYTNEAYGYPQTYMANDILALQTLYGANFTTHQENTVYSWSPATGQEFINGVGQGVPGGGTAGASANRVFMTVWDGNGIDTYDLSNYTTAVSINLNPGASSITSTTQIANLGNGHYAQGNVYNAYLYNNDARSYIDNAIGGSGNDSLNGNAIANNLNGGAGDDTLCGGAGNDTIIGGSGTDTVVFAGNEASYLIAYDSGTQTFTVVDQRAGSPDGTDTITGVENFQFADGAFASSSIAIAPYVDPLEYLASNPDLILAFGLNLAAAEQHYATTGFYEHRFTHSFDALEYLASNWDLIQTFGLNLVAAEQHYVNNGFNEHRATTSFDAVEYLASNPDLIRAFGLNTTAAEQHYVTNGFNEHRGTTSFNATQYLANYADLTAAFGPNNLVAAEQHYITAGLGEGRTDQAPVINGDGGNNTLLARNGAIMTGGAGADNFAFNLSPQTPVTITDFAVGSDHLQFSASGFGHGLTAGGTAALVTAATASAATHAGTDGYFIFDNAHTVWWDPTGGGGADAIALAKLTGIASLHASDFLLA
jgi:serralysin